MAKGLIPNAMSEFLDRHAQSLSDSFARSDNIPAPTPEEVEQQFLKVIAISESGKPAKEIVIELGRLAVMAQLLTDPSATSGLTLARRTFSDYADEHFSKLVAAREPLVAGKGSVDPRPAIQGWTKVKYERYSSLASHINLDTGARIGTWDTLSVPFAQMQVGFSAGVNATATIWIYAWRAAGGFWVPQE
jgi:hypothetical protein